MAKLQDVNHKENNETFFRSIEMLKQEFHIGSEFSRFIDFILSSFTTFSAIVLEFSLLEQSRIDVSLKFDKIDSGMELFKKTDKLASIFSDQRFVGGLAEYFQFHSQASRVWLEFDYDEQFSNNERFKSAPGVFIEGGISCLGVREFLKSLQQRPIDNRLINNLNSFFSTLSNGLHFRHVGVFISREGENARFSVPINRMNLNGFWCILSKELRTLLFDILDLISDDIMLSIHINCDRIGIQGVEVRTKKGDWSQLIKQFISRGLCKQDFLQQYESWQKTIISEYSPQGILHFKILDSLSVKTYIYVGRS